MDCQIGMEIFRITRPYGLSERGRPTEAKQNDHAAACELVNIAAAQGLSGDHDFVRSWPETLLDGRNDSLMGTAPAQIMVHASHDLGSRRVRVVLQQNIGIEQHARRAVSALKRPVIDESLLEGVQHARFGETLDDHHFRIDQLLESGSARPMGFAVDHHSAGAANALAAAVLGAGQRQIRSQDPQEHPIIVGGDADRTSVEIELNQVFQVPSR
jgi:hypothetical protein